MYRNKMTTLLVVHPDVEKQDILLKAIDVETIVTNNVSSDTLREYTRIGFLYHQKTHFPFVLDDVETIGNYFSNEWIEYFKTEPKTVDLLSCEYHRDLYESLNEEQSIQNFGLDGNAYFNGQSNAVANIASSDFENISVAELSAEFEIEKAYSVPSDNKPYIVDVAEYELPTLYKHFAVPKLEKDAFLLARK